MNKKTTTANSPEDDSSKDRRAGKVEVNIEVRVKIFMLVLRLYLPAFLTAIVRHSFIKKSP